MTDIINAPATRTPLLAPYAVRGVRLDLHGPGCSPDCTDVDSCDQCGGPLCLTHDDGVPTREPVARTRTHDRDAIDGYDHTHCTI